MTEARFAAPVTQYWLMKSEPGAYSIEDLKRDGKTFWDGIRNYEARNSMQQMQVGDQAIFYHSSSNPPGAAGIMRIARRAYPDHTAFDPSSKYHDPKSDADKPTWFMVDVEFVESFTDVVPLSTLREDKAMQESVLLTRFRAPSVQPLTQPEFDRIVKLGRG